MSESRFAQVAVDAPIRQALTYRVPAELMQTHDLRRGTPVRVPLGRRQTVGVILQIENENRSEYQTKDIIGVVEDRPVLAEPYLQWLEWLAKYYMHPIGQVIEGSFAPLKRSDGKKSRSRKASVTPTLERQAGPPLSLEQNHVIQQIQSQAGFQVHLLRGVTGSGKTEVYMSLLEGIIKNDLPALVLVPEISLTPQLTQRFLRRFGDAVAVIHSGLTPREKTDQWWAMVGGDKKILIGARSALFCPLPKIGMIVVDEEHENSFKQDEKLKYHARDAAIVLAQKQGCPIVLGSATPSLESWRNATLGRYRLHEMKSRVENRPLPTVEVLDLREAKELRKASQDSSNQEDRPFWMTPELHAALLETHGRGKQSALFLNRRGVAQSVVCPACGDVPECPNCAVSLTLHGQTHLLCHYCDYHQVLGSRCRECHEGEPKPLGLGTEKIEADLKKMFPGARVARMDRDEITSREDLEVVIAQVERGDVQFLVGTQMIAKGLDFPNLELIGLVMADIALNMPDFRASERAFQLFTQVAGRSGRHVEENPGRVIIQTYNPDHPSIQFTREHDYSGFAEYESRFREELRYPPFWRLNVVRIQGMDLAKVQNAAQMLKARAHQLKKRDASAWESFEILGPAPCPLAKLRNQFRYQLLIKGPEASSMSRFAQRLMGEDFEIPAGIKVQIDVDAINLL